MKRNTVIYGLAAGVFLMAGMLVGFLLGGERGGGSGSEWLGYSFMIVALSAVFIGVKRYRDRELGGVIRFGTAFLLGLGITVLASVIYVASWEVVLSLSDYAFAEDYSESVLAAKQAAGLSGAELEAEIAKMAEFAERYANPLYRLPITFLEIFPVGLLITLISAAILRNSKILPASA